VPAIFYQLLFSDRVALWRDSHFCRHGNRRYVKKHVEIRCVGQDANFHRWFSRERANKTSTRLHWIER